MDYANNKAQITQENKKALREEVLRHRDSISIEERLRKSTLINEQLLKHLTLASAENAQAKTAGKLGTNSKAETRLKPNTKAVKTLTTKTIAVYQAMRSEVLLDAFISAAYQAGSKICFPCMMQFSGMVFREASQKSYESQSIPFANKPLKTFEEGDPQLQEFPLVAPKGIDVVIVPLVAFDKEGNRLGYGGGNYDRFLSQLRKEVHVIGIAFSEQRAEHIPTDKLDQKLSLIISA